MSPNGELASGYWPLFESVFSETSSKNYLNQASDVIRLGRRSKDVDDFTRQLNEKGLKLPKSTDAAKVLDQIHKVYPPKPDPSRFAIPFVTQILRQEEIKIEAIQQELPRSDFDHRRQLESAAKNHRALIEEHRSDLGHIQSRLALMVDSIPSRERFPISGLKNEIIDSLSGNYLALIVVGETGSGKTTQIPQYLAEAGFAAGGRLIGCTQLCREEAQFSTDMVVNKAIKYMDEYELCNELIADPSLSKYSVIMIDDAHEKSITTDVLFGLIKNILRVRINDFRLVVTSANSDGVERLSNYLLGFKTESGDAIGCKTIVVPHHRRNDFLVDIQPVRQPCTDPLTQALWLALEKRTKEPSGNILLFLSGKDEVDFACRILFDHAENPKLNLPPLVVLRACSSLRSEIDPRVFETTPPRVYKVVVATAAAEAPLAAMDSVVRVIDLGLTERRVIHPLQAIDAVEITPISKASANRRTALGRTRPGDCICYRLYTEGAYCNEMRRVAEPEIQTANLGAAALRIKACGENDILDFELVDHPPPQHVGKALTQLYHLEAMDENWDLTETGRKMALFPLDPPWSRALVTGVDFRCSSEVLIIIAMAQVDSTFFPPWENQAEADQKRQSFICTEGDHLSLLAVYKAWETSGFSSEWCDDNFVHFKSLRTAYNLRNRLEEIMNQQKLLIVENSEESDTKIRKAITSGLFFHAAWKDSLEGYRTLVGNHRVYVHPQSALFHQQPSWVVYNKLVLSEGKECMFGVMAIDPDWLVELAPRFFKAT